MQTQDDRRIAEEAADWLLKTETGEGSADEFSQWLKRSPRHLREFLLAKAVFENFGGMRGMPLLDVEATCTDAEPTRIFQLPSMRSDITLPPASDARCAHTEVSFSAASTADGAMLETRMHIRRAVNIIALMLLATLQLMLPGQSGAPVQHVTSIGEHKVIALRAGVQAHLNTDSQIDVSSRFTPPRGDPCARRGSIHGILR